MAVREIARRVFSRGSSSQREPLLSFGSWDAFPEEEPRVVQICHPDWRGVRTAAYAFRTPVVECDDLKRWGSQILDGIQTAYVDVVVIQGWPPGSEGFAASCHAAGITVKCVFHSSPALQGTSQAEAAVVRQALDLLSARVLTGLATVKVGVAEAFSAFGHDIMYLPNRAPDMPDIEPLDLGPGFHVGVFGEPWWPKNIATQVLAVGLIPDGVAHLTKDPGLSYVSNHRVVHGEMPWETFLALQGSVDLNLYVTLTECYPLTPIESYLLGVPCLISRTSAVFRGDPELWRLTTVDQPDEPVAIAEAAETLLEARDEAVGRARAWIAKADIKAQASWLDFVARV